MVDVSSRLTDGDHYQCGASTPGVKEASWPASNGVMHRFLVIPIRNSGCPLFTATSRRSCSRVRHPGRRTRLHRAEASAPADALRRRVIVHGRRLAAVLRGGVRAGANALNRRDFGYSAPTTLRKVIARTIW